MMKSFLMVKQQLDLSYELFCLAGNNSRARRNMGRTPVRHRMAAVVLQWLSKERVKDVRAMTIIWYRRNQDFKDPICSRAD